MTIEEQLAKAQADLEAEQLKVKNQNSHITKIETENKRLKNSPAPTQPKVKNSAYEDYTRNKWRQSVIVDALTSLIPLYSAPRVEVMRTEVNEYAMKHMVEENTTQAYVVSVFELLFGRAMGNPQHAIHQVKVEPVKPVVATPIPGTPVPTPTKPLHETLPPHVMSPSDPSPAGAGNIPPGTPPTYKNVKDSFSALKGRIDGSLDNSQ